MCIPILVYPNAHVNVEEFGCLEVPVDTSFSGIWKFHLEFLNAQEMTKFLLCIFRKA